MTKLSALTLRAMATLLAPLWGLALARRLRRGKETQESVRQKTASAMPPRPPGPLVWGHAVGVGESLTLATLFDALGERLPDHHFLITSTSRTSGDALQKALPPRCLHQFTPADTPAATDRFLRHWQPNLALWCELDLWPGLLSATALRGIPMWLVNARVLNPSSRAKRWGRPYYRRALPLFERIRAQDEGAAQALIRMGAPADRVGVAGTIKALARQLPCDPEALSRWQGVTAGRPVWLGASSQEGEERVLLQTHALLRQTHPTALLIIAPRYPARGAEVAQMAQGFGPTGWRSRGDAGHADQAVYVADTLGEMGLWFRLAPVAFVGGSLQGGGKNPFEALALGCRVLHGPHVQRFADSYAALAVDGLTRCVQTPQEIAEAVRMAWLDGRAPDLAGWHGARGARELIDELAARLTALNVQPSAPPRRA